MNIEKLPSGNYRVRKMINGQRHSITFDKEPGKREIEKAVAEIRMKSPKPKDKLTFEKAAHEYIDSIDKTASPATVAEYTAKIKRYPEWFRNLCVYDITQLQINQVVNAYAKGHAPKTVADYNAFISVVLGVYRPDFKLTTKLPQRKKTTIYIPSTEEIKAVLEASKDTQYYILLRLATYGLSREELCALTINDLNGNVIHIKQGKIADKLNGGFVIKEPKTTTRERNVVIDEALADLIREQGCVYSGSPNSISEHLRRTQRKLGLPYFSLHKFRHYFASKALTITNMTTVQAMGGWATDNTLKKVYAHALEEEQQRAQAELIDQLSATLFDE